MHPRLFLSPLRTMDIAQINAILDAAYGGYPYPLKKMDPCSIYLAARVTQDLDSRIVAFVRAVFHELTGSYEIGGLITVQQYRIKGIGRFMIGASMDAIAQHNGDELVAEPVCAHTVSQRLFKESGFRSYGIEPFKYSGASWKELGHQPESVTIVFRSLSGEQIDRGRRIFVPEAYIAPVMSLVGRDLGGETSISSFPMPGLTYGERFLFNEIHGSSFLDVPANWPEAIGIINDLRQRLGFRLSSVLLGCGRLPSGQRFDLVRMYCPPSKIACTFDKVQIADPRLRPLFDFMRAEAA